MTHTSDSQHTPASDGAKPERNWRRHGSRYRARRRAVDILFEAEARDVDPVAIVEDRVELARQPENAVAPIAEYTRQIVAGAAEELDGIDETIERYLSADWALHRLPAVDRAILRVAVWELLHNPDVPRATAVVEGVELASEYSHNAAPPYIHAVLDDVAQSLAGNNPLMGAPSTPSDAPDVSQPVGEDAAVAAEPETSASDGADESTAEAGAPEVAQSAVADREVGGAEGTTPSDAPEGSQPVGEDTEGNDEQS